MSAVFPILALIILVIELIMGIMGNGLITSCVYELFTLGLKYDFLTNLQQTRELSIPHLYVIILHLLEPFIPFLIFMVSATLLITALWRHTRRMQREITNFQDPPQNKAHVGSIKALIFTVFYFSYWVALISSVIYYFLCL
ncbi:taste receptor type 2 member 4-like [Eretmochelys imbricata]